MINRLLQIIRNDGPISRADLSRITNVSKPTVSALVRDLEAAGLVRESGFAESGGGRPPRLVEFCPGAAFVVGMDIGGSTARAVLADLNGNVLGALREPTKVHDGISLHRQILGMRDQLLRQNGLELRQLCHVAIGTPGVVDPATGLLAFAPNVPALEEEGFVHNLTAAAGHDVSFHNDANLAALGEATRGQGQGASSFVYLAVGTGLGATLVIDGRVHFGVAGRAGEIGYLPYPPGSRTNLEQAVSGHGLVTFHQARGGSGAPADVFAEAAAGEGPGHATLQRLVADLAWTVTMLATAYDPEMIILGGGIGSRMGPWLPEIHARAFETLDIRPRLALAQLGDDAGLTGAVATALDLMEPLASRVSGSPNLATSEGQA